MHKLKATLLERPLKFNFEAEPVAIQIDAVAESPAKDRQKMVDIRNFIRSMRWSLADQDNPITCTWVELLAAFQLSEHNSAITEDGKRKELEDRRKEGCLRTKRWDNHLRHRKRTLKNAPTRACHGSSLSEEIADFKRLVRKNG